MVDKLKPRFLEEPPRIYPDWLKEPADADKLEAQGFQRDWHNIKPGENFVRIAAQYEEVDWQRLTNYNWGTVEPRHINWYLWHYCNHYIKPTSDEKNYSFIGEHHLADPAEIRGLWVPRKIVHAFHRGEVLVPRSGTGVIDTLYCPYLSLKDDKCKQVADGGGAPIDCGVPSRVDAPFTYKIAKSQHKRVREAVQTLNAELLWLGYQEFYIHRGKPAPDAVRSAERLTILQFDFLTAVQKLKFESDPKRKRKPAGKSLSKPRDSLDRKFGDHTMKDLDELRAVAQHLRNMKDGGVLGRVVARGYVDRDEAATLEDSLARSRERAEGILEILNTEFALTLSIEPGPAASAEEQRLHEDRIKRGFTPAKAVGCGAADAPFRRMSADHRVVIVDPEPQPPGPREIPEKVSSSQKCWIFYEYDPGTSWEDRRSMLYAASSNHNGICQDMREVWRCQKEALACVNLLFTVLGKKLPKPTVDELKWRIMEWDAHFTSQLEVDLANGTRRPFTSNYWVPGAKRTNEKGEEVDLMEVTALPGAYPPFMTEVQPAEDDPSDWPDPDHGRFVGRQIPISAEATVLRELPAPPEGEHAFPKRRIHFE